MATKYITCAICGRVYHESMGNDEVCCFCMKRLHRGLYFIKVTGRQEYVLWSTSRYDTLISADETKISKSILCVGMKRSMMVADILTEDDPIVTRLRSRIGNGVVLRSTKPVDGKSVFHWGYHKMLWRLLEKHPEWTWETKYRAMAVMYKRFLIPYKEWKYITQNDCFACASTPVKNGDIDCLKCPLEWDGELGDTFGCCNSGSSYSYWVRSTDAIDRQACAKCVARLSLSENAEKLYTLDD